MTEPTTTWYDIKLATLQKMFSANGREIIMDSSTAEYIYGMPQVANEALELLSTAGKFLTGEYTYVNRPVNPIFAIRDNKQIINGSISFTVENARAYYFRASGDITLTITVDGATTSTSYADTGSYEVIKGTILNSGSKPVTFLISTPYQANVTSFAAYDVVFKNNDAVPEYEEFIRIPLKEVVDDFYQLYPTEIYFEGDETPRYISATNYYQEAGHILVIPRKDVGSYTIYYRKYPPKITFDTADKYILPIDPEVAAIMPLYMASQLYKDDDNSIATVFRNEFEVARDALSQQADVPQYERFTSVTGWC